MAPLDRLGFSPSANLIPRGAPGNRISSAVRRHFILSTSCRPPIVFAEPCRMRAVVTPPASARQIAMSSASITSAMETSALIETVPSFTSPSRRCASAIDDARSEMPARAVDLQDAGGGCDLPDFRDPPALDAHVALERRRYRGVDRDVSDHAVPARRERGLPVGFDLRRRILRVLARERGRHGPREEASERELHRHREVHRAPSCFGGLRVAV
jgi:hypothetical protein